MRGIGLGHRRFGRGRLPGSSADKKSHCIMRAQHPSNAHVSKAVGAKYEVRIPGPTQTLSSGKETLSKVQSFS